MTTNCIPGTNTTTNPAINANPAFGVNPQNCYPQGCLPQGGFVPGYIPQSYVPQGYVPQNFLGGFRPSMGWNLQNTINPAIYGSSFYGMGVTQPWNVLPSMQNCFSPIQGWNQFNGLNAGLNWGQNFAQNIGQNWGLNSALNCSPFAGIQSPISQNLYAQYLASCGVNCTPGACLPGSCTPGAWNSTPWNCTPWSSTPWNSTPWNVQPITGTTPFSTYGVQPITGTTPFVPGAYAGLTNVQPITGTTPFVGSGWNTSTIPNNFINTVFGATNVPTPVLGTGLFGSPFTGSNFATPFNTVSPFNTFQNSLFAGQFSTPFTGVNNLWNTIPTFGNFQTPSFFNSNPFSTNLFNQTPFVNGFGGYPTGIQNFGYPLNTTGLYTNGVYPTNIMGYPTNFTGYPTNFTGYPTGITQNFQGAYPFNVAGNELGNVALAREAA
ncbi:MAG: hypothetical protein RBS39_05420 [Phycisphaerales bacterium]|jgi:hypothetical protein|nr:hypothetical protein [Phycisphaerales bacterium]